MDAYQRDAMNLADARNQKFSEARHGGNRTVSQNRPDRYLGHHGQPNVPATPVSSKERERRAQEVEISNKTESATTDDGTENVKSIRSPSHQVLGDGPRRFDGRSQTSDLRWFIGLGIIYYPFRTYGHSVWLDRRG